MPTLVILAAAAAAASPAQHPALDYGAPVTYEDGVRIGQAFVMPDLVDPASATFTWPYEFVPFDEKVPLFKRTTGYATCFTYNAKNALGGYVGAETYRITIHDGKVVDYARVSDLKFVPDICKELVTKFGMGPAPSPRLPLGITFEPSPTGVVVATVSAQSVSELAGIKPGDVMQSINGVDLRGKSAGEVVSIVASAPASVSISIEGKGTVIVDRNPKPSL